MGVIQGRASPIIKNSKLCRLIGTQRDLSGETKMKLIYFGLVCVITAHIRRKTGCYILTSVCLLTGGTPYLANRGEPPSFAMGDGDWGINPSFMMGGIPILLTAGYHILPMGVPHVTDWGYPHLDWMGAPPSNQDWMGVPLGPDEGTPLSEDRSAERAFATWRAVCLLRSHRRTLL